MTARTSNVALGDVAVPAEIPRSGSSARAHPFTLSVGDDPSAIAEWDMLGETGVVSPYQTRRWSQAWARTCGVRLGRSCFVFARWDGRPAFLLPLLVRREAGVRIARWIGGNDVNFAFPPMSHDAAAELTPDAVASVLRETARLLHVDAFALVKNARSWGGLGNPFAHLPGAVANSPVMSLELGTDFDALLGRLRSKSTRKTLRKKERQLARSGDLAYRILDDDARVATVVDALIEQKSRRLASQGCRSHFDDAGARSFLHALAQRGPDGRRCMEMHVLSLDDHPIAIHGNIVSADRISGMVNSIESDAAAANSPGEVLMTRMLRSSIERGLATFDLGFGEAAYKKAWCPREEGTFDLYFSAKAHAVPLMGLLMAVCAAKRAVRASPWATAMWRHVVAHRPAR